MLLYGRGDILFAYVRSLYGGIVANIADTTAQAMPDRIAVGVQPGQKSFPGAGNYLEANSRRIRRSDGVYGLAGSGFGTNLVQIEISVRGVASGCVAWLVGAAHEFRRPVSSLVLVAA